MRVWRDAPTYEGVDSRVANGKRHTMCLHVEAACDMLSRGVSVAKHVTLSMVLLVAADNTRLAVEILQPCEQGPARSLKGFMQKAIPASINLGLLSQPSLALVQQKSQGGDR